MSLDYPPGDRQPKPGTSGFSAPATLGIKERSGHVIGHATTVIADAYRHASPVGQRAYLT